MRFPVTAYEWVHSRRASVRGGAALVLLFAGWCLLPAAARADCGDYVMIGHPAAGHGHDSAPLTGSAETSQPARPKPCSGPSCSRKPAAPVSVPPSTDRHSRAGEWGWLITPDAHEPTPSRALYSDLSSLHPQHQPADVFHPPRGR